MKKKHIYELDWDDSEPLATDVAFLLFHSVAPNYAFVDDLNKLYGLALRRTDDIALGERSWPLFIYHDPLLHLDYHLIERPPLSGSTAPMWTEGHKLLIVKGERAVTTVATIHDEFCTATPSADPSDLLAIQHTDLLESLRSSFTTTTLIDPSATLPASTSKKTQRDYTSLCNLLEEILDCLDMENICSN